MKKIAFTFALLSGFSFASAASCSQISMNLVRGNESSQVTLLQNFLYGKKLLAVSPNGYFGPSTEKALKVYQKSVNISQTGTTGPLTRTSLNRDMCQVDSGNTQSSTQSVSVTATVATTTQPSSSVVAQVVLPVPTVTSIDRITLLSGGTTTWPFSVYGTGFSTSSSNSIYFKQENGYKKYLVATSTSIDGKTLIVPANITGQVLSCGAGCKEMMPAGDYDISVVNSGGESNTAFNSVKSFTVSATTGTLYAPIQNKAVNARIGTLTFGATAPLQVIEVIPVITGDGISTGSASSLVLKDELTGLVFVPNSQSSQISQNQSKILGLYGSVNSPVSGRLITSFKITVQDYIGNKQTVFISPEIITSISSY